MFCYQCEQTNKGTGCTQMGICGKEPDVAALQDALIYALKGLSAVAVEGRKRGITDHDVNGFICEAAGQKFLRLIEQVVFDMEELTRHIIFREELYKAWKEAS